MLAIVGFKPAFLGERIFIWNQMLTLVRFDAQFDLIFHCDHGEWDAKQKSL